MTAVESETSAEAHSAVIRRAGLSDALAVADILISSRRASAGSIPASVHSDDDLRGWVEAVVIPQREVWVAASIKGQVLAVLVLADHWVDQLYVAPGWTGNGLGSRLIEFAKSRRPGGLQLWTFQSNLGAQRFYERHGFSDVERTDGSGNEEGEPDVRFVWLGS